MAIETERKYLIRMPSSELLSALPKSNIEQIYLALTDGYDSSRIRRREFADKTVYTKTCKRHVTAMSAVEDECEITADEFSQLASLVEEGSRAIRKTRHVYTHRGYDFEIDVYPFWDDRAVMEVELPSEDSDFTIPSEIEVIKELTGDRRYTNHALAHAIPNDLI